MKFHFWHIAFSIFFIALTAFGYLWLAENGRLGADIPLADFFLMALAAMRLVRLFTYDIITAFVRNWFVGAHPESFLGTIGALLHCPWCTGLWFSFIIVFAYFATSIAWYVIFVLALSSVVTIFQLITNLIGWSAELKKQQAKASEAPRC